jgi:hypothetical protein
MSRTIVTCMGDTGNAHKRLVRKPERKRPLGRPRHRGEDSMKMDIRKIDWQVVVWIHLAQDRDQWQAHVNMVVNFQLP